MGSSFPAPPRLRARLRVLFVKDEDKEISFRRGLGWIGTLSPFANPLRDWVGVPGIPAAPRDLLDDASERGDDRLVLGDITALTFSCFSSRD